MVSMWYEPMFQSVWSGPSISTEEYVQPSILNSLYSGGKVEKICRILSKVVLLYILMFSCIFRYYDSKYRVKSDLLYLFF